MLIITLTPYLRPMDKETQLKKTLEEIQLHGSYEQLAAFKDSALWNKMKPDERDLLAKLFVTMGTRHLERGEGAVLEAFDTAAQIAPQNYQIYYMKGMAYATQSNNAQFLISACKSFAKAAKLNACDFDSRHCYATTLIRLGLIQEEVHHFQEALVTFAEIVERAIEIPKDKLPTFYWDWGQAWFFLGKLAGEALDFRMAIEKYTLAADHGLSSASFWNAVGDAYVELAFLIGRKELFFEALDYYNRAIAIDPASFQSWFNLGCTHQCIFEITTDAAHFARAVDCFEEASSTDSEHAALWFKWGQLLATMGKFKRDTDFLQTSLEKFAFANKFEPRHPGILGRFGEAQMLLGANLERVDLLKEAEDKICRSIEIHPDNPEIWYLYGVCLNEFGRYFADSSYYKQAIEKFQHGLSLNQADPLLWYGLAMSHYAMGDLDGDKLLLEKSVRYFSRVLEFGGQQFFQFWNDWGVALMRLAEITNDQAYLEASLEKFENIINHEHNFDDEKVDVEWLYNYGCALDFFGDFTDDLLYYEKAVQVLNHVLTSDSDYAHARYNLALALSHLGESASDIDSLTKAIEHYQILLAHDPEDEMAWNDWGLTLVHLGQLVYEAARPDESLKLYEQAEAKFSQAISLGCLSAFYNLACLHAIMRNYSAAMHFLERAASCEVLPAIEDLLHDEWLDELRETPEFKTFLFNLTSREEM